MNNALHWPLPRAFDFGARRRSRRECRRLCKSYALAAALLAALGFAGWLFARKTANQNK